MSQIASSTPNTKFRLIPPLRALQDFAPVRPHPPRKHIPAQDAVTPFATGTVARGGTRSAEHVTTLPPPLGLGSIQAVVSVILSRSQSVFDFSFAFELSFLSLLPLVAAGKLGHALASSTANCHDGVHGMVFCTLCKVRPPLFDAPFFGGL